MCLLDFSRAYDRVWRPVLVTKMSKMGISECTIKWISSFLSDRRAKVRWNNTTSKERIFRDGLPQGSVLAPLLWLIYVNDLPQQIKSEASLCGVSLFADDTALLTTATSLNTSGVQMQPAINAAHRWCQP